MAVGDIMGYREKNSGINQTEYLAWVYYNVEGVSFIDEILDEIGITERIEKPGKLPEEEAARVLKTWRNKFLYTTPQERFNREASMRKILRVNEGKSNRAFLSVYSRLRIMENYSRVKLPTIFFSN